MAQQQQEVGTACTTERRERSKVLKKIWIAASGSRGDVQPYVAVGAALTKKGYDVTFFTPGKPNFLAMVEGVGMRAVAITDDFDLQDYPNFMKAMYDGDNRRIFEALDELHKDNAPMFCKAFLSEMEQNGLPDLCLAMALALYMPLYLAINHDVPYLELNTYVPYHDPNRGALGLPSFPFGLNKFIVKYILPAMVYKGYKVYDDNVAIPILHRFTRQSCTQNYGSPDYWMIVLQSSKIRDAFSPTLAQDHPAHVWVGTTVMETQQQLANSVSFGGSDLRAQLEEFIENGHEKPVYLGWGSMVCKSPEYMAALCAEAIHASKTRAIVYGGGGDVQDMTFETLEKANGLVDTAVLEYARDNIMFVGPVPHEWLLPRVAATVHHGGAGTTTAAMRAGVPTIITPLMGDQFDFSHSVNQLGIGFGFDKSLNFIKSKELADVIVKVLADVSVAKNAAELGTILRAENGAEMAAEETEKYWREFCVTGQFHERFFGKVLANPSSGFQPSTTIKTVTVLGLLCAVSVAAAGYLQQVSDR